jgi:ornithine carbamoyltransferase
MEEKGFRVDDAAVLLFIIAITIAIGVNSMGGLCVHTPLRLGHREAVADFANYLDNWIDAVVCRTPELGTPRALAEAADAPVIKDQRPWYFAILHRRQ